MLITCPSCQSEYNVPGTLPPGRMVKCAKCQFKWAPVPAEPPPPPPEPQLELRAEPLTELPAELPPAAPEPLAARPPRRRLSVPRPLGLAWAGSACLLAALLAAAILWRGPVMHAWPPAGRLYAWLHLAEPAAVQRQAEGGAAPAP